MIFVLDSRRPSSLAVDVNLRLEVFLENAKQLLSRCCALGRVQLVDAPSGLIVPTGNQGKMVQVVCRGRPVTPADVSCARLVDVQENGYGDGFGWKFLIDGTLTATRIRDNPLEEIVVLTTDLMLAGEDSANEARFFSQTSEALGTQQAPPVPRISLVFVEVVGSSSCSVGGAVASNPLTGWNGLQRLREGAKDRGRAFALDLIDNTAAMFDSQLRCWLRDSSPRQACSLRLPATETFSGVVIEVEMTHYLLDQSRVLPKSSSGTSASLLHKGFSNMKVVQGVRLDTLDQGLCRGDPLLCIPSRIQGSRHHSQANRKLFMAVCAELNERDMGLLLSLRHPSTFLEERWLLLPQIPQDPAAAAAALGAPRAQQGGPADAMLVDRGLLIRLAMKEEVLEEGEAVETSVNSTSNVASELSVERAAASASLDVLDTGTYNPLKHSSGLFELLASQRHQPQQGRTSTSGTAAAAPRTARAASNAGAGVGMSANRRLGCEPDQQHQQHQHQHQHQHQPHKHRRHQSSPSLSSATLPPSSFSSSMPRRATIGGLGGSTKEGARGTSQHQQQQWQPAKMREVSLRFADTPQRQQQKQRHSGRGKSPTTRGGDAGVRVGGGGGGAGGNRDSKSKSAVTTAVTSGGRRSKRSGAPQGGRGKAKAGGREREGGSRGRGVSDGGGWGGGGREDDEDMMML